MNAAPDFSALDPAAGQALFERNWLPAPASTAASDGLGPYFNARSCAACHRDGGAGAVDIGQMNLVTSAAEFGEMLQLRAVPKLAPEVRAELEQISDKTLEFDDGSTIALSHPAVVLHDAAYADELTARTSLRRAPSLHGLALLDLVPRAELELRADPDDRDGDGISGRLAANGGRFGWTATSATLREQVARALSLDLGLSSPQFPSAAGDCTSGQHECLAAARSRTGDEHEAPDIVLDLLLSYLGALPPPRAPGDEGEGAELFTMLGCAACHTPQLAAGERQIRPFTDLLLHDLGPGLASGGDTEWRTAPLWGLAANPAYLHDGRAATLDAAVLWHGGEAAAASDAYRQLNSAQRGVLQAWLLGL